MDISAQAALGDKKPLTHRDVRSIIIGIVLAMLLGALDQTIVATALPTIGRDLGDVQHIPWVVTSYLLAATAVTPLYGKFSDIMGRRFALLLAIVVFIVGSVACAVAPTMLTLVVARGLQGLGGGGLISLAQTIIADVVAPRERGRYQAYIAGVFVSSSLLGPVLGGFFAEHLHWSMIFWINLPLGFLALWMTNSALRRLPRHERPHRLDVLGAVLMVGATVSLLLALSWGGRTYGWASGPILGLFAGSAILWGLFALRLATAGEPLIPPEILRNPVVRAGTLAAAFGMGTYIGLTIYMPVYFETIMGLTAAEAGLALIPLMVGTVCGATVSGRMMMHIAHYKRLPIAGVSVAILATAALAWHPAGLPFWLIEVALAVLSIGLGTLLPVTTVAIQNSVDLHQLGTATGTMNFFRQLGGALMVALLGAIVLGGAGVSAEALPGEPVRGVIGAAADMAPVFRWTFAAAAAALGLALAGLIVMEERPLRGSVSPPGAAAD